ncbi:MAG: orotate phosphoribosyltransferase [Candidatus Omnitrophica bacterium]|nr:orotate phosphoribosyltransferase [Candidatus Omnitrophota bacterium]
MKKEEILKVFKDTGAILEGHFVLSSGLHSPKYLQCALLLERPDIAEKLCQELASKFRDKKPDVVVAPAIGGVVVSYEVARALGVRSLFTERVDGKMTLRRGFKLGKDEKVLLVEDVITTGLSTKEVLEVVNAHGARPIAVGSIVNRAKEKIDFGCEAKSLIDIDIPVFKNEECPLCKKNIPITKPGSRKTRP